ncbi:MAG: sensor histidine kinase [Lachnospiraceae bacterium]|nr:sensor histidine kinase [Lachnospiraceae bacterium]
MIHKIRKLIGKIRFSIQTKIVGVCILANMLVFVMDMILLVGLNNMSSSIEQVYQENVTLNTLAEALTEVQDSMTTYLSVKTSDSLENYYRNEQNFAKMLDTLNNQITGDEYGRMERSIRNMSEQYLSMTSQTIEAKRGRNVEKYRVRYESATDMYHYISTYINSLNSDQLQANSEKYVELSRSFRSFEMVCVWIMVCVMVANVIIAIKLTGTIIAPLKMLAGRADEVAEGNFDIELLEIYSKDEIATVTNAFNSMVTSIREYIEQIQMNMKVEQEFRERELKMETHLKEAELKYLQAQINPHFLFNTLNAGAQLAMMEDADRTYEYIQNMSEIFRYTVRRGDEIVTLRDELTLVDHYIFVLNVRFSGEIHYEKQVDEELLNVEIPSMIVQPIVENCVNHGIREMEGKGRIVVSVYKENEHVCICIRDNGKGMSSAMIEKVMKGEYRKETKASGSNGIALDNVIARLRYFTGTTDCVRILSEGEKCGTQIIITLGERRLSEEDVSDNACR